MDGKIIKVFPMILPLMILQPADDSLDFSLWICFGFRAS